jgi:hypothetical protein
MAGLDVVSVESGRAGSDGTYSGGTDSTDARGELASRVLRNDRWHRVSWMFAAIWLVYLAQPLGQLWAEHDLVRRYLGLATLPAGSGPTWPCWMSRCPASMASPPPRNCVPGCRRAGCWS